MTLEEDTKNLMVAMDSRRPMALSSDVIGEIDNFKY
jgi:hypothetical protein